MLRLGLIQALGGTTARLQRFLASVLRAAFAGLCFSVGKRSRCSSDTRLGAHQGSCVQSPASARCLLAVCIRVKRCFGSCAPEGSRVARTSTPVSGSFLPHWFPSRVGGIVPPNSSFKPNPLRYRCDLKVCGVAGRLNSGVRQARRLFGSFRKEHPRSPSSRFRR